MQISGGESILIHKLYKTLQKMFVLAETAQNQPPNCNGRVHVYQHKHSVSTLPRAAVQTMNAATSVLRTEPCPTSNYQYQSACTEPFGTSQK